MSKYNTVRTEAQSYGLHKIGPKCHRIVKNLKDYTQEQEAIGDLIKLLDGKLSENDITGNNYSQSIEAGKLSNRILCLESAMKNIRESLIDAMGDSDKTENAIRHAVNRIDELLGGGEHGKQ